MVLAISFDKAIVVNLGDGDKWWSTRLFLLASLLRSLTLVRQVVFSGRDGRFAGMASPNAIFEAFVVRFLSLDKFEHKLRESDASQDRGREIERQIAVWFEVFVETPNGRQASSRKGQTNRKQPKIEMDSATRSVEQESQIQIWVREDVLDQWFGERLITRCVQIRENDLTMSHVQQIVDCLLPDVPVEFLPRDETQGTPTTPADKTEKTDKTDKVSPDAKSRLPRLRVIDRDAFGLELAREWVRAGLPRNPAR